MKKILFLILIVSINTVFSQKISHTLFSEKLNEDRKISVSLPPSYEKNTSRKYPVLFLLDADFLLDPVQGALSYGYYWDDLPEIIIVSIYQEQSRETDCNSDSETGLPDENSANFFEFIGGEVLPFIEKKYRVAPFKLIAGLDTTAGFLNYYLYKETPLFEAYIAMSPELPMDMEIHLPERLANIQKPLYYYHSMAEGDLKTTRERIQKMDDAIKVINNPNLNYKFDDFRSATHYSAALNSIPSALFQIFAIYQPISINEYQEKIATLPFGYTDYLSKKYETLEKYLGIKTQIRLSDFKAIEAAIYKNKDYNDFDKLSQLADKDYPKTILSYYYLAKMYELKGDIKHALRYYQNGYQMSEIAGLTKEMMLDKVDELSLTIKNEKNKPAEVQDESNPTEPIEETTSPISTEEKKPE